MPPRYPFSRNQPSSSSTSTTTTGTPSAAAGSDRPIVVSASGRAPNSPALALSANSPSQLRSRIPSPRHPPNHNNDVFENDTVHYPSPSAALSKGKSNGKAKKRKDGWIKVDSDSPSQALPIPRYDARGYPTRDRPPDPKASPESSKSVHYEPLNTLRPSRSIDSLSSEVSSTGAGVNEETNRFLYPPGDAARVGTGFLSLNRPSSYYAPIDGASPNTLQPPTMSYALNQPSYSPYEVNPERLVDPSPVPSLYGESKVSLAASESSMTHFRKFDALAGGEAGYANWSVTSKGGKQHLANMFQLPADPTSWSYLGPEADDDFHDPDIRPSKQMHFARSMFTVRGATNIGCLVLLLVTLVTLFAGYPVIEYELAAHETNLGGYNLGGVNLTGQIPDINMFQLIDKDTPTSAYSYTSMETGDTWALVFSDEFNNPGRTFYDGDDPYWEAVDLHYWSTNNLEWYDPKQITTIDGALRITLSNQTSHDLNYTGGMMSTWNRFCFTGGYVEASVSLPGTSSVYGLWPAIWSMGNLGRAGYGGSLDGMWPYTYDSCDVGTLSNQTLNGLPESSLTDGDPTYDNVLSYLPGQRLSACTCPGDTNHPGPTLSNGSFIGRGAPEIDMFEATVDSSTLIGGVSQSGQWAPFNPHYEFLNTSTKYYEIFDDDITEINSYKGGVYQQATSGISQTDQDCYTQDTGCFSVYGFEYAPGVDDGYISWVNNGKKAWTVRAAAMGPNSKAEVGQRLVSEEPMYLIMNLGISENFGAVDYDGLASLWPVHMDVDYIRVYQDPNQRNIGCDPSGYPTAAYIAAHADVYANPNITTWEQSAASGVVPKNSLIDTC
ncbi:beta-glucan synthesis-associated protein-domain-containing protein [Naematelia encephala]|uniref:Beta-glucan synthesis-associated protein-domain-containing protein n=1 Tax=Naematelia encephala TaxID=71784 RepID=A0A1Y2B1S4_9TREE|nr:beta-glucan synthesis-associated protein-domain-containing protein [Naematelia encephala]